MHMRVTLTHNRHKTPCLQIEFIDMHFGTGPADGQQLDERDPHVVTDHLREIEVCSQVSKSVFFIVSCFFFVSLFIGQTH